MVSSSSLGDMCPPRTLLPSNGLWPEFGRILPRGMAYGMAAWQQDVGSGRVVSDWGEAGGYRSEFGEP